MKGNFTRRRIAMTAQGYEIVAGVIRSIPDPALRQTVADHFATEFHKRSQAFDPYAWEKRTGGKVKREVPAT